MYSLILQTEEDGLHEAGFSSAGKAFKKDYEH